MGTDPAIVIEGLTKSFGGLTAVDGVDLCVESGSVFGLLGPNGAGKTTIVRLLATLLRPDRGQARIFGYDVVHKATAVRSMIGLTGQYASVDENLSAAENLQIFGRLLGLSGRAATRRADELLEQFELTAAAHRPVRGFSGGMRRRLDLAVTLITLPPLIFLDEPTTGLDPHTRVGMWTTVRELVECGATILLTTQYLEEADALADRIAVMDHGRIVADGTTDELKASAGREVLRLEVSHSHQLPALVEIVERATGTAVRIGLEGRAISVPLAEVDYAADIFAACRQADIRLRAFGMDRPDLNEVFLALTGHPRSGGTAA
ncbi:ATP-binding cassette domain-containing protein [Nocardia terpenica]|uniref:ABC transporter n=1 Tax=Nocardia terpenica TaxID=455432 RepID=A0A164IYA8_9NOCA|nr:ATP-binding cassette domain-containing protein [Nocardia terpenica]KZM69855.1 ABC transporter [Nocardia terpenica]NQE91210.1 ATP-binding cassette domain-containing protein [Nocardia terpenica]